MAISKFETAFRGKGDTFYQSIFDVDTKEELKSITNPLRKEKKKFLFQVQKDFKTKKPIGWRIFLEKKINLTEEQIEFLKESNLIEKEPSKIALQDAMIAFQFALDNDHIDLDYILKIHELLARRINKNIAGRWRDCEVYIGGRKCPYENKYFLRKQVQEWLDSCIPSKLGAEEDCRRWHIAFENIHPFTDGNGRVGRILLNIHRLRANLPILIIKDTEKQKYYEWFHEEFLTQACQKCGAISKNKYCDDCYGSSTCLSCGKRSYGKPYCFKCYSRA